MGDEPRNDDGCGDREHPEGALNSERHHRLTLGMVILALS
jgi:hypothetical protein